MTQQKIHEFRKVLLKVVEQCGKMDLKNKEESDFLFMQTVLELENWIDNYTTNECLKALVSAGVKIGGFQGGIVE